MSPTFGSLFAGIGGMDLGLERAGWECRWQVEIDPFCQRVLEKHWPHVKRYGDIRAVEWSSVERVDLIAGGFPCQDITSSGLRAGIAGERSGLYSEVIRAASVLRPRWIVLENVSDLLSRGMGTVLGELAALGMDAWWDCFPAAALGVPQRRWRTFIVSYPSSLGFTPGGEWLAGRERSELGGHHDGLDAAEREYQACARLASRADYGLPGWVDRMRGLGNAVVPQVAEWIGRRILEATA